MQHPPAELLDRLARVFAEAAAEALLADLGGRRVGPRAALATGAGRSAAPVGSGDIERSSRDQLPDPATGRTGPGTGATGAGTAGGTGDVTGAALVPNVSATSRGRSSRRIGRPAPC